VPSASHLGHQTGIEHPKTCPLREQIPVLPECGGKLLLGRVFLAFFDDEVSFLHFVGSWVVC